MPEKKKAAAPSPRPKKGPAWTQAAQSQAAQSQAELTFTANNSAPEPSVYDWNETDMSAALPYEWMTQEEGAAAAKLAKQMEDLNVILTAAHMDQDALEKILGELITDKTKLENALSQIRADKENASKLFDAVQSYRTRQQEEKIKEAEERASKTAALHAMQAAAKTVNAPASDPEGDLFIDRKVKPEKQIKTDPRILAAIAAIQAHSEPNGKVYNHAPHSEKRSHLHVVNKDGAEIKALTLTTTSLTVHTSKDEALDPVMNMRKGMIGAVALLGGDLKINKRNKDTLAKVASIAIQLRKENALHDEKGNIVKTIRINGKTPEEILGLPAYVVPTTTVINGGRKVASSPQKTAPAAAPAPAAPAPAAATAPTQVAAPPAATAKPGLATGHVAGILKNAGIGAEASQRIAAAHPAPESTHAEEPTRSTAAAKTQHPVLTPELI
jgi:hypothetical protein